VDILLVEPDRELADLISRHLEDTFECTVHHAVSNTDALHQGLSTKFHLAIISFSLPDGNGLALLREMRMDNDCPVIFLADELELDEAIEAMRLGAVDLFRKPFQMTDLAAVARQAAEYEARGRREHAKQRRMRRVASRIIQDRREVQERMDLICRDFVQAYRHLAEKVTEAELLTRLTGE
jgi:DNA-binding NtrC family response regulator